MSNKIPYLITYISYSCVNIHDNDKICLFIVKNDDGLIKAHNLSNEYISIIDIPVSNIVEDPIEFNNIEGSDKLFGMELNKTKLKDILTIINTKASLYHENDYYFHITCSKFKNNILEYGLLTSPPVRVINYEGGRRKRKYCRI